MNGREIARQKEQIRDVYEVRAVLDRWNSEIHKIEEETGLKLAHFIFEEKQVRVKTGFQRSLGWIMNPRVMETAEDDDPGTWQTLTYAELNPYGEARSILSQMILEMRAAYQERKKLIKEATTAWWGMEHSAPGIMVHFGLYQIELDIQLEVLAKYQIYIPEPGLLDGYHRKVMTKRGVHYLTLAFRGAIYLSTNSRVS